MRSVPVPIPQPPQIIVKEVVVNASKDRPVIQQVPVVIRVPVRINVPVPVHVPVERPDVNVVGCNSSRYLDLKHYSQSDVFNFKQNLLSLIRQQRERNPEVLKERVVQRIPVYIPQKCNFDLPDLTSLRGCVTPNMIDSLPIQGNSAVSFKTALWRLLQDQRSSCPLVQQVPIPIPQKPRIIVVEKPVGCDNTSNIVTREKPVFIPSPPRVIIKEVPVHVSLPRIEVHGCDTLEQQIESLTIPGHNPWFKIDLLGALMQQRKCAPVAPSSLVEIQQMQTAISQQTKIINSLERKCDCQLVGSYRLPQFVVPQQCVDWSQFIRNLSLPGHNPIELAVFRSTLFRLLNHAEKCGAQPVRVPLPLIKITSCEHLYDEIATLEIPGHDLEGVQLFKQNLLDSFSRTCRSTNPVPSCRLPQLTLTGCQHIDTLAIPNYNLAEISRFKQNIAEIFLQLQQCSAKVVPGQFHLPDLRVRGCHDLENQISSDLVHYNPIEAIRFKQNLLAIIASQRSCSGPKVSLNRILKLKYLRSLRYFASQLYVYKKRVLHLQHKVRELLGDSQGLTPSLEPAVPLPMMHMMRSFNPQVSMTSLRSPTSSVTVSTAAFVKNLHEVYTSTQKALKQCMDAILAQTLTNYQCNNHRQLIQDSENQIRFLNSIIVDIQKKNEEQRARIEILEAGYSPAMASELNLFNPAERQLPPRMYCDICEEFDLHETEDCPQQNSDLTPEGNGGNPQQPFCWICQSHGHTEENCPLER